MVFYYKLQEIQNYSPDRALTVIGIEEKILTEKELQEQGKTELYKDCITYEGDMPFLAYPILEEGTIRPATRVELINLGLQSLNDGEYIEDNEIIQVSQPNEYAVWNEEQHIWTTDVNILPDGYILKEDGSIEYIHCTEKYIIKKWNREKFVWEEGATEEQIKEYCGNLVTDLLMQVLATGCKVNIQEKEHIQILDDRKLTLLNSTVSSAMLDDQLGKKAMEQIPWSFKDDGTDSVILTKPDLYDLAGQCMAFTAPCYMVADTLKKQQNIKLTLEDFLNELSKTTQMSALDVEKIKNITSENITNSSGGGSIFK